MSSLRSIVAAVAACILHAGLATAQTTTFTTITGEIGPGALYEIAIPTTWNGELVLFAHGIGKPTAPVALPEDVAALRASLTARNFAVAYSSFSVNGYGSLKDGSQRTHQLRGIFVAKVGQPTRVYLLGRSQGGLIAVMLAERFPSQYDGALAACGLLGGGAAALTYLMDARVLFEYFFPEVTLPGLEDPPGDFSPGTPVYTAVLAALRNGLVSDGRPTLQFARAAKLPAVAPAEVVNAGMNAVGFTVVQGAELLNVTHGHMPYGNGATWYSGSNDDAALNAGVARYVAEPSAVNYMEHYYAPTGDLHIPVVTLHTTRDPVLPFFHEEMYAERVENAGRSQYLLQRAVDAFGHCAFPPSAETTAFDALVDWVRTGVKPQN